MGPLLKNLLGNSSKDRELSEEMRAVLQQIQAERSRIEKLVDGAEPAAARLQDMVVPIAKAGSDLETVSARLHDVEDRLQAMSQLVGHFRTLEERAEVLEQNQKSSEAHVSTTLENVAHVRQVFEELSKNVELATSLQERLHGFLEIEKPFQLLRGDADAVRTQVETASENMARLREQHDRLVDQHKLAMSKMEAMDRRRDDFGRSLSDKERRISAVEEAVHGMDGMQQTVDDLRREMQTVKATADLVNQKSAALEAQRQAVDRALAEAERLDQAMHQLELGMRQQRENQKELTTLQERVSALQTLHESVLERSTTISQLQRDLDDRTQAARQELVAVTDETKKTIERFDFERRGIESVTQRVADLRGTLADCESRFRQLEEPARGVAELRNETTSLATRVQGIAADLGQMDGEMEKVHAIRRDLDASGALVREFEAKASSIEAARPAIEAGLRDLEQLRGADAAVRDALEQSQNAHSEIAGMHEDQSRTRAWLDSSARSLEDMRNRLGEIDRLAQGLDAVEAQARRIGESTALLESRQAFAEDLHRRLADLGSQSEALEERGTQLMARMEAAEKRFVSLGEHAEEAERLGKTMAAVTSGVNSAERKSDEIRKTVTSMAERCESVEALAAQTETLKKELDQRHGALSEAKKELQRASTLRREAAESAGQLEEQVQKLTGALAGADRDVARVDELSARLADRAASLQSVEEQLRRFEERMERWELGEQQVSRSLEQFSARQSTIEALRSDLDRMFTMAETTASHVREITTAHQQVEESRAALTEVMGRLKEFEATAGALDERKRQMTKAEERLARAEALLADVHSSLAALEGQKDLVDQAIEKTGSLQYLLKQAEAAIVGLGEERKTPAKVRPIAGGGRREHHEDDQEGLARAA